MTLALALTLLIIALAYFLILSFLVASISRLFLTLHFLLDFRDPLDSSKDKV